MKKFAEVFLACQICFVCFVVTNQRAIAKDGRLSGSQGGSNPSDGLSGSYGGYNPIVEYEMESEPHDHINGSNPEQEVEYEVESEPHDPMTESNPEQEDDFILQSSAESYPDQGNPEPGNQGNPEPESDPYAEPLSKQDQPTPKGGTPKRNQGTASRGNPNPLAESEKPSRAQEMHGRNGVPRSSNGAGKQGKSPTERPAESQPDPDEAGDETGEQDPNSGSGGSKQPKTSAETSEPKEQSDRVNTYNQVSELVRKAVDDEKMEDDYFKSYFVNTLQSYITNPIIDSISQVGYFSKIEKCFADLEKKVQDIIGKRAAAYEKCEAKPGSSIYNCATEQSNRAVPELNHITTNTLRCVSQNQ